MSTKIPKYRVFVVLINLPKKNSVYTQFVNNFHLICLSFGSNVISTDLWMNAIH